jgi:hypothetical protein
MELICDINVILTTMRNQCELVIPLMMLQKFTVLQASCWLLNHVTVSENGSLVSKGAFLLALVNVVAFMDIDSCNFLI